MNKFKPSLAPPKDLLFRILDPQKGPGGPTGRVLGGWGIFYKGQIRKPRKVLSYPLGLDSDLAESFSASKGVRVLSGLGVE